ncbi:peptidylprolyl isomerase [Egbenema bharatensis]|uniref:peptidylprolyl isomerase n=1 Tax=Egbenema bharatensis TaxID=3463334 RepID=UPI003A86A699
MNNCLKIGNRLLDGDQIISALVKYKLLEPLVGQILLDEMIKNVPLSKQELFQRLVGAANAPLPDDFNQFLIQWCQHQGVTPTYFENVLLRDLRIEKFKQVRFANQVESEFLRHKSDFDQIEYSLIQLTDLALAQELYFQLRDDDADFARLAQQFSIGHERQTGGWIGPVSLSTLPIEAATLLRSGGAGVIYGPIPVADRFWLIRLERLMMARLTSATRANLIDRLYHQWLQTQVKAFIASPQSIAVQSALPASSPAQAPAPPQISPQPTEIAP